MWFKSSDSVKNIESDQLREFVYLDQVSIYSFLASMNGALPEEYTSSKSKSSISSFGAKLKGKLPFLEGHVGGEGKEESSTSASVLHKFIIQSHFKKFMEQKLDIKSLKNSTSKVIKDNQLSEVNLAEHLDTEYLPKRGELVEVEVQLNAHDTYKMSQMLGSISSMVSKNPTFFENYSDINILELVSTGNIVSEFLGALVPVMATAKHYKALCFKDKTYILHEDFCKQLNTKFGLVAEEITFVGLCEISNFWKNPHTVLFDNSTFTMLLRLENSEFYKSDDWQPVALLNVFKSIMPNQSKNILDGFIGALDNITKEDEKIESKNSYVDHISNYVLEIAKKYEILIEQDDVLILQSFSIDLPKEDITFHLRKEKCSEVETYIAEKYQVDLDQEVLSELRSKVFGDAGLLNVDEDEDNDRDEKIVDIAVLLKSEIISIYW